MKILWTCTLVIYIALNTVGTDNKTVDCSCYNGFCFNGTCLCDNGWTGSKCELCFGRIKIVQERSYITDGIGKYRYMSNCTWIITHNHITNDAITLNDPTPHHLQNETLLRQKNLLYMRLNNFSAECGWDHLYIYDGDSIYSPLLASFSGTLFMQDLYNLPDLIAHSGQAYIYFYSDDSFAFSGFNMSYWRYGCLNKNCSGNGLCKDGKCVCYDNWEGKDCEIDCKKQSDYCSDLSKSSLVIIVTIDDPGPSRTSHAIISNENDHIFLFGGYSHAAFIRQPSADTNEYTFIYRYNITSREWHPIKSKYANNDSPAVGRKFFEKPLIGHTTVYRQNKVYLFGGHTLDGTFSNDLRTYDTTGAVWLLPPMTSSPDDNDVIDDVDDDPERPAAAATRRFYLDRRRSINSAGVWHDKPFAVTGHTAHSVRFEVSGKVEIDVMIVLFGYNPVYGYLPYVQEYYPEINEWIVGPATSGASILGRAGHVSVVDPKTQIIYVSGGMYSIYPTPIRSTAGFSAYYPLQRRWEILEPSPFKLSFHAIHLYGDHIIVYGGQAVDSQDPSYSWCFSSITLAYDIRSNQWKKLPDLYNRRIPARFGHASLMHKKKWYIHGGFNGLVHDDLFHWNIGQFLDRCEALLSTFLSQGNNGDGNTSINATIYPDQAKSYINRDSFDRIKGTFISYVNAQIYGPKGRGDEFYPKDLSGHWLSPNETHELVKSCFYLTISKSLAPSYVHPLMPKNDSSQFPGAVSKLPTITDSVPALSNALVDRIKRRTSDGRGSADRSTGDDSDPVPTNVDQMSEDQFMAYYHRILKMAASSLPIPITIKPLMAAVNQKGRTLGANLLYHIGKADIKVKDDGANFSLSLRGANDTDRCRSIGDCRSCLSTRWSCQWCFNGCQSSTLYPDWTCGQERYRPIYSTWPTAQTHVQSVPSSDNDKAKMAQSSVVGNTYILEPGHTAKSLTFLEKALFDRTMYTNVSTCPIWFNSVCSIYTNCMSCHTDPNCIWGLHRLNQCVMILRVKSDQMSLYRMYSTEPKQTDTRRNQSTFHRLSLNKVKVSKLGQVDDSGIDDHSSYDEKRNIRGCPVPCSQHTNCLNCTESRCIWCSTFGKCIDPGAYTILFPYGQCTMWASAVQRCPPQALLRQPSQSPRNTVKLPPNTTKGGNNKSTTKYDRERTGNVYRPPDAGDLSTNDAILIDEASYDGDPVGRSPQSPHLETAPGIANLCTGHKSCSECQTDPGCGWCDDGAGTGKGTCLPGGLSGPISFPDALGPQIFKRIRAYDADGVTVKGSMKFNFPLLEKTSALRHTRALENSPSTCPRSRWFFVECPACQCNGHATCIPGSNECGKCKNHTTGPFCGICESGFRGDARNGGSCTECSCNGHANVCHRLTGACHCDTKGIIGHNCDTCDKVSHYFGVPTKGGTCYYTLNTDYMFTFNLTKPDDQYYTKINLMNRIERPDSGVEFKISCSGMPKMNVSFTKDLFSDIVQIIGNQYCSSQFTMVFDHKYFVGDKGNTTFFISLYDFEVPLWIMVSFSISPKLDILQFFITFLSCFLFLLFVAAVSWKIKQKYDIHRRRQRLFYEMEQMATRPFSSLFLYLESKPLAFYMKKKKRNRPTPIALEPLHDERSAVLSVIVRLPTTKDKDGNPVTPYGASGLALGSTLVSMATINLAADGDTARKDLAAPLLDEPTRGRKFLFDLAARRHTDRSTLQRASSSGPNPAHRSRHYGPRPPNASSEEGGIMDFLTSLLEPIRPSRRFTRPFRSWYHRSLNHLLPSRNSATINRMSSSPSASSSHHNVILQEQRL